MLSSLTHYVPPQIGPSNKVLGQQWYHQMPYPQPHESRFTPHRVVEPFFDSGYLVFSRNRLTRYCKTSGFHRHSRLDRYKDLPSWFTNLNAPFLPFAKAVKPPGNQRKFWKMLNSACEPELSKSCPLKWAACPRNVTIACWRIELCCWPIWKV